MKHLELLVFPSNGWKISFYEDCMSNIYNHFLFLKFISMKRASIVNCFICRKLQGISSLINTSKPPPNWFLSSPNGFEYPYNKNCLFGKDLSSFVYVIISMSILPQQCESSSDLFLMEFMFIRAIIILLTFFKRIFFNSFLLWETDWSLADLSLGYSKHLVLPE